MTIYSFIIFVCCEYQKQSIPYKLSNYIHLTDWDAQASEPQGILFGNRYQLGNFDQCMKAPWSKTHPELKTKYCLADIGLERTDKAVRRRVEQPYSPYQSALDFIEVRSKIYKYQKSRHFSYWGR